VPVTGGEPSADPAVVALVQGDTVACTGTVIAPRAVLTAGHCAGDAPWPEVVIDGARVAVAGAIVHPGFDPATLARDLATLVARGYVLRSLAGFDLFPQTPHVEALAVLERD